jgi:hypothetical protein
MRDPSADLMAVSRWRFEIRAENRIRTMILASQFRAVVSMTLLFRKL